MRILRLIAVCLILTSLAVYAEQRHGPKATAVDVSVGTADGEMRFVPATLTFRRGTYYKLILHNPSPHAHYFTSDAFATHIFTRKVEVLDQQGKTAVEVHGAIHDLEIKPGTTVEWFFYPMTKGTDLKLFCHKNDHEAQGMTGSINIVGDL